MSENAATPDAGELLVVTTRSRLRSAWFFPVMLLATRRIRRQLARTEGLVRWASLVAGPTEFWTITVWHGRRAMQEFVGSDAHGEIMWRVSRWLDSLWLMRWRPPATEHGAWDGMRLASPAAPAQPTQPGPWSVRADRPIRRPDLSGAGVVVVRLGASRLALPAAIVELARLRRALLADPAVQRTVLGIGGSRQAYLLAVCTDRRTAGGALDGALVAKAAQRWGDRLWVASWRADNEFGHWDGWRLRHAIRPSRGRDGERSESAGT